MGRAVPQKIAEPPPLPHNGVLYYQAFSDLDSERHIGMSVGRIPWSAVETYAAVNEFDPYQTHALHYVVGKLDAVQLRHIHSASKKDK